MSSQLTWQYAVRDGATSAQRNQGVPALEGDLGLCARTALVRTICGAIHVPIDQLTESVLVSLIAPGVDGVVELFMDIDGAVSFRVEASTEPSAGGVSTGRYPVQDVSLLASALVVIGLGSP